MYRRCGPIVKETVILTVEDWYVGVLIDSHGDLKQVLHKF
jgi:hypothetical protein